MPDGSPLQSKKFIAYLIAELSWKFLAVAVLYWARHEIGAVALSALLAIILVSGFVEAGYIIGQSSLDQFLGLAKIAAEAGVRIEHRGMTVGTPSAPDSPPASDPTS
jgi:hypothetical protein